jgi:hypothetical protein
MCIAPVNPRGCAGFGRFGRGRRFVARRLRMLNEGKIKPSARDGATLPACREEIHKTSMAACTGV